jgi:hypothetical protein
VLEALEDDDDPAVHLHCLRMHGCGGAPATELRLDPRWQQAMLALGELEAAEAPDLRI